MNLLAGVCGPFRVSITCTQLPPIRAVYRRHVTRTQYELIDPTQKCITFVSAVKANEQPYSQWRDFGLKSGGGTKLEVYLQSGGPSLTPKSGGSGTPSVPLKLRLCMQIYPGFILGMFLGEFPFGISEFPLEILKIWDAEISRKVDD